MASKKATVKKTVNDPSNAINAKKANPDAASTAHQANSEPDTAIPTTQADDAQNVNPSAAPGAQESNNESVASKSVATVESSVALMVIKPCVALEAQKVNHETVAAKPSVSIVSMLDKVAAKYESYKANDKASRIDLGNDLLDVQKEYAAGKRKGFMKQLAIRGIPNSTAYDLMDAALEARGEMTSKREKRQSRQKAEHKTAVAKDVFELRLRAQPLEVKRLTKLQKKDPKPLARVLHEAARVFELYGEHVTMKALATATQFVGKDSPQLTS